MSAIQLRTAEIGLLFLLIFLSGLWLRGSKPLSVVKLTIHKLLSLLALILIAATIYEAHTQAGMSVLEWSASAITGLVFILTIATGGLLSTGTPVNVAVSAIHKVTPFLTVLSTAMTVYLLAGRS